MFGLQFAISAGRCTRGVYMQLIKVDKKRSNLPYDYVLVLDTEGLRAPELEQLKNENDNQLATFVIGLSDVTILNIKGENVTDVSDILQIAVHAFLRMKLTKNRNRTVVFVHQNVPAIDAKQKMKYGCQKHQDTLDKMTLEACAAENVVDISTFNEVIEFDSENNVWCISGLWHGDPPMAPINPGYAMKIQEVKRYILNSLSEKQRMFLTFSDMTLRVEDLRKAVLAENFVFSFRNSLSAKVYRDLEKAYHEKCWLIQNGITEWVIQTAIVQMEKCMTPADLERCCSQLLCEAEHIANTLTEKSHAELKEFFQNHNLRLILVQWETAKLKGLITEKSQYVSKAVSDIQERNDSLMVDCLQITKQEEYESEILNEAKKLADETKGKPADEQKSEQVFEEFWEKWVNKLTRVQISKSHSITERIQLLLLRRLHDDSPLLIGELDQNPLSETLTPTKLEGTIQCEDIEDEHLSINISSLRKGADKVAGCLFPDTTAKCKQKAAAVANNILMEVADYLTSIENKKTGFQDAYATNVINRVISGVEVHNQESKGSYTMKNELMVKLAVCACRYAVVTFMKMQQAHDDSHSVVKKIERFKQTTWSLFKNTVNQKKKEVIAADILINQLGQFVEHAVQKVMSGKVVDEMLGQFPFKKYSLLYKIYTDLMERGFDDYISYIRDPKGFAQRWIAAFMDKHIFTGPAHKSKYVTLAEDHIQTLLESVKSSISAASNSVQNEGCPNMEIWVQRFCEELTTLPVNESKLRHVSNQTVEDFVYFQELLIGRLEDLRKQVLNVFEEKAKRSGNISWEGDPPSKVIMDKLWGCEATCPFCSELCQNTSADHTSDGTSEHTCIQHRPAGIEGQRMLLTGRLVLETCNYNVNSIRYFPCKGLTCICQNGKWLRQPVHFFWTYKSYLPGWDIAPSSSIESSKYWMWVMAKYKKELAEYYDASVPNVPNTWQKITKEQAIASLRVYSN